MLSSSEARTPVKTDIDKFFDRIVQHLKAYSKIKDNLIAFRDEQLKLYQQEIEDLSAQADKEDKAPVELKSADKKNPAKKIPALKLRQSAISAIEKEVEQLIKILEQVNHLGVTQEYKKDKEATLAMIMQLKAQGTKIPTLFHTKTKRSEVSDFLNDVATTSKNGAVIFAKKEVKQSPPTEPQHAPMYSNPNYYDWELACAAMGKVIAAKRQSKELAMPQAAQSALANILRRALSPDEVKDQQTILAEYSDQIKAGGGKKRARDAAEEKRDARFINLFLSPAFFKKKICEYDLSAAEMKSIIDSVDEEMKRSGCDKGLNFSNPMLIGAESAEVRKAACDFLQICFAEKGAKIREHFHARMKKGLPGNAPRCIIFLTANQKCGGQTKKLCFIALSSLEEDQVKTKEINEFLKDISLVKTPQKDETQYIILDYVSKDFKKLIANLTKDYLPAGSHDHDAERRCAEFGLLSAIAKLKAENGSDIDFTGVLNCRFYPYRKDLVYKNGVANEAKTLKSLPADKLEEHVCFTLASGTLDVGSDYCLPTIPLCPGCQTDQISYEAVYRAMLLFNKMYTKFHGTTQAVQPLSPKDPMVASVGRIT
ncbi:MAG: hypothetical protein ACYCQI_10205 [Gammaproteobacteria bacterium]